MMARFTSGAENCGYCRATCLNPSSASMALPARMYCTARSKSARAAGGTSGCTAAVPAGVAVPAVPAAVPAATLAPAAPGAALAAGAAAPGAALEAAGAGAAEEVEGVAEDFGRGGAELQAASASSAAAQ